MKRSLSKILALFFLIPLIASSVFADDEGAEVIDLPAVERDEGGSLFDLLFRRSSVRSFDPKSIDLNQLARLLFAGQGITRDNRFRTVPSGGALYPIDIYVLIGDVDGLAQGIYKYLPQGHRLQRTSSADRRAEMAQAALGQTWIADAPVVLVICVEYDRITDRYGERGERYALIESGCTAQNISLECVDLGLGTTLVGAFRDDRVERLIEAPDGVEPLLIMPIGTPAND